MAMVKTFYAIFDKFNTAAVYAGGKYVQKWPIKLGL
jgi:hypothetical protein